MRIQVEDKSSRVGGGRWVLHESSCDWMCLTVGVGVGVCSRPRIVR